MSGNLAEFPHCDADVLHAPGACRFCDQYPDAQAARQYARVNFTGGNEPGYETCPSELRRPLEKINRWPGNIPQPEGEPLQTWFGEL